MHSDRKLRLDTHNVMFMLPSIQICGTYNMVSLSGVHTVTTVEATIGDQNSRRWSSESFEHLKNQRRPEKATANQATTEDHTRTHRRK